MPVLHMELLVSLTHDLSQFEMLHAWTVRAKKLKLWLNVFCMSGSVASMVQKLRPFYRKVGICLLVGCIGKGLCLEPAQLACFLIKVLVLKLEPWKGMWVTKKVLTIVYSRFFLQKSSYGSIGILGFFV